MTVFVKAQGVRKDYAEVAEDTEFAEKKRGTGACDRKSPPFAKGAKDGAPSSTLKGKARRDESTGSDAAGDSDAAGGAV